VSRITCNRSIYTLNFGRFEINSGYGMCLEWLNGYPLYVPNVPNMSHILKNYNDALSSCPVLLEYLFQPEFVNPDTVSCESLQQKFVLGR